jgi:hypothetical protein
VTPINGFAGTVILSQNACSISPGGSLTSCAVGNGSGTSVTAPGSATVTIYTVQISVISKPGPIVAGTFEWSVSLGLASLVLLAILASEMNKRRWHLVLGLFLFTILGAACIGCGGSAEPTGGTPTGGTPTGVTYTVTVTGTSGALTHSASFTFVVQ